MSPVEPLTEEECARFRAFADQIRHSLLQVVQGQEEAVDAALTAVLVGGHALFEGPPGVGKSLLVNTLADILNLEFARQYFTVDMMPSDIIGTWRMTSGADGDKHYEWAPGVIFTQVLLAEELNRTTPKTQSALLEAMETRAVTVNGKTRPLPRPFFVFATQNPMNDNQGTYELPEAQLDRFLCFTRMAFPRAEALMSALERAGHTDPLATTHVGCGDLLDIQVAIPRVVATRPVLEYVSQIVRGTWPNMDESAPLAKRFVRQGVSVRAARDLLGASRANALSAGRGIVSFRDVQIVAARCLRHRIVLNFEGEAEGLSNDSVIANVLESLPVRG